VPAGAARPAVNGYDQAGCQLQQTEGETAEEFDLGIVSPEEDGSVGDQLVKDVQDGGLMADVQHRAGQHVEDGAVERAENSLQGEDRGAAAPLCLQDEFDDELEDLVGVLLEDGLPELVHEAGRQVEYVGGDMIGRATCRKYHFNCGLQSLEMSW